MANDTSLTFSLYGKDVSASKSLQDLGAEAGKASGAFGRIKEIAAGVGLEQGVQALATKVISFGKDSINAFQDVGKEVRLLQRYTGDSAEEMSKLRFAAEESGVSAETLALGLGKMSKAAATTAGEKKFEAIGIQVRDANGHFKGASALFEEVAGKLGTMQNGVEKTNAIMQIFGRSGMELAPLLNQGSEGIAKFKEEAQKFGLVLGQDSLNAVKDNIMAQREFHAAVTGLQVQLGQYLYPAITVVTKAFSEVIPILGTILKPLFQAFGDVLKPIISFIGDIAKNVTDMTGKFAESGKGTSALTGIFDAFKPILTEVKDLFELIGKFLGDNLIPIIKALWEFTSKYLIPLWATEFKAALKVVEVGVGLVFDAVKLLIDVFNTLKSVGTSVADTLKSVFSTIGGIIKGVMNGIISGINAAIDALNKIHVSIPSWVPGLGGKSFGISLPNIPMLAEGGIVTSPTIAMIGEAGPEAVVPLNKGFGGGINVVVNVGGSVVQEQDLAIAVRDQIAILMRRRGLNPSILGV